MTRRDSRADAPDVPDLQGVPDGAAERYDPAAIQLLARLGGPSLVQRMVAAFVRNLPDRIMRMRGAADAGDLEELAGVMHSLKSITAQMGLRAVSERCTRTEDHCGEGNLAAARLEVARIAAELPADADWLCALSNHPNP